MEKKITIIIPAHNVAGIIQKAINSITCHPQATELVEILVVENGSTDDTVAVVSELQAQHTNLHLIHSAKGVSCARNRGIEIATGEWLVFLDADDELLPGAMDVMLDYVRNPEPGDHDRRHTPDICFFGHKNGEELRPVSQTCVYYASHEVADELMATSGHVNGTIQDALIETLSHPTRYLQVWAKLFRRSLIVDNHIRFDEKLRLAEDSEFTLRCIAVAQALRFCPELTYQYTLNPESVMRTWDGSKVSDYRHSMEATWEKLNLLNTEPQGSQLQHEELQQAYHQYVMTHFNIAMVRETFHVDNPAGFGEKVAAMKRELANEADNVFAKSLKAIPWKRCISPRMIAILLLRCHCYHLAGLIYHLRAKQNHARENR